MQIVVQGIPWAYTWKELKDVFIEVEGVDRADIAIGYDGRSRVRGCFARPVVLMKWLSAPACPFPLSARFRLHELP